MSSKRRQVVVDEFCDRHGQDIAGSDEYGVWFGTEDFPIALVDRDDEGWRLRTSKRCYVVNGWLGADDFSACVRARSARRARDWAVGLGVRGVRVNSI